MCVCVCVFALIVLVFLLPFDLCTHVFVTSVPINCCHCNVLGAPVVIVQAQYKYTPLLLLLLLLLLITCLCRPRNIFPENLLQAAFQHTKTVYRNDGFVMPDGDLPENVSNAINVTLLTTTQTTLLTTVNDTNATYIIIKEKEIRWVRTFPMADGINGLGK